MALGAAWRSCARSHHRHPRNNLDHPGISHPPPGWRSRAILTEWSTSTVSSATQVSRIRNFIRRNMACCRPRSSRSGSRESWASPTVPPSSKCLGRMRCSKAIKAIFSIQRRVPTASRSMGKVLLGHVAVAPVRGSRLVDVTAVTPDAALSQRIADAWGKLFIETNLEQRYDASDYARRFLENRLEQMRAKLEELSARPSNLQRERESSFFRPDSNARQGLVAPERRSFACKRRPCHFEQCAFRRDCRTNAGGEPAHQSA